VAHAGMIAFVVLATALTLGAVFWLARPLLGRNAGTAAAPTDANVSLYRDQLRELERDVKTGMLAQEQSALARAELERRLLEDADPVQPSSGVPSPRSGRGAAIVVGIAIPVCAALLYLHLGTPKGLDAPKRAAIDPSSVTVEQFQQMTEKLAARLQSSPNDPTGWLMLGRAYKALQRFPEAVDALAHAERLEPNNPEILVERAEALGLAHGGQLEGEPTRLLEKALLLAPENQKALTLAGAAAFGRADYDKAIGYWQRLAAQTPPGSELGKALASGIAEAQARLASQGARVAAASPAAKEGVSGVVRLSPQLAANAGPEDTVFVFARAADGGNMPLAVLRKRVKDLPLAFKLDDSMAMRPGFEVSSAERVVIAARVSKSGNAMPEVGDLEGVSTPVAPGTKGVAVVIDHQVR